LSHLLTNSLLSNTQFGFCPCSSIQEALIAATNSWHQYLDVKQSVGAVFFDLSKAFDLVPHLDILRALTQIGVTGSLHTWFADYLVTCRVLSLSINHKTIKIGWWALARDNTVLGSFYFQ